MGRSGQLTDIFRLFKVAAKVPEFVSDRLEKSTFVKSPIFVNVWHTTVGKHTIQQLPLTPYTYQCPPFCQEKYLTLCDLLELSVNYVCTLMITWTQLLSVHHSIILMITNINFCIAPETVSLNHRYGLNREQMR
jgi:hypothetical protein